MSERTIFQSMSRRHLVSLGPNANVREAACVMTQANCGSVVIVDLLGTLLGIVTERDLMSRVLAKGRSPETTLLNDVMTRNPICVKPETLVADAVVIMIERGFRHLPILGPTDKLMGVFSVRDALPREIGNALSLAEFNAQVNDAVG